MRDIRKKRFYFQFIIWLQIFILAGAPVAQNLAYAASVGFVKEKRAPGSASAKEFFDNTFGQEFILSHPTQPARGFLYGLSDASARMGKKISRLLRILPKDYELASSETLVNFETQPIETLVPLGINLKSPNELKAETYTAEDGKKKPQLRFERAGGDYNNSRYRSTLPEHDIVSMAETENLAMFLNRDGTVYGVDKTNPMRNFGKGYIGIFPIAKVEIQPGATYELRFNLGPFSRGGLPVSDEVERELKDQADSKITLGSLMVIRKWNESAEGENPEEISAILSDSDQLKGLLIPTIAIAVAAEKEKPDIAIELGKLNAGYEKFTAEHDDFFGTAKSAEIIGKIRSLDGAYISQAVGNLSRQLSMLDESRGFSLENWIRSEQLNLTPTSKQILETIFSKGLTYVNILETSLKEFETELNRHLAIHPLSPELRSFFESCISVLQSSVDTNDKIIKIRELSKNQPGLWTQWLNADATNISEPAEIALGAALNPDKVELWDPTDKIAVTALYELSLKLETFLRHNSMHPQAAELQSIADALKGLKRAGSSEKITKLVAELRRIADESKNLHLLDLIAAASIDENSAFAHFGTQTKLVHPKNIAFFEKVKNSPLMGYIKKAKEIVFTGPNLLMAACFTYLYVGHQFSTDYRSHLSTAWIYQFGFLQLLIASFWTYGRIKTKEKNNTAAVGMASLGIPVYGGLLSIPTGILSAKWSGQENFTYAVTHGIFPTTENGGYLAPDSDPAEARAKILSQVQEKEAKLATLKLEAFRAVAAANNISLSSGNWSEMQNEWQQSHIALFKAEDEQLALTLKEATLSADPKKIAATQANIQLVQFRRMIEFREFQQGVQNAVALVANQLDSMFSDYKYTFAAGLTKSETHAIQEAAKKYANDTKGQSSLGLKLSSTVHGLRAFFRNNTAKALAWPLSTYRAAQQAVIRPEVARVVYSNWRTDMVVQYMIDGAWNGAPVSGVLKRNFGINLPTRANPSDPDELFAQPGSFMGTHPAERGTLFQQHIIYSLAAQTRAQSELAKPGSSIRNPFADDYVPESQKNEPFFKSLKRFMKISYKGRKLGIARYLNQNFINNTIRFAQPAFLIEFITSGLVAGFPFHKVVAQYFFFRGLGMWWFGLPWLPFNLGMPIIAEEGAELRKNFITSRMKFIEAVESKQWTEAKLRLAEIKTIFDQNDEKFSSLEKLGARSVDSLTPDELISIAKDLESSDQPFFADSSHLLNDATSLIGGIATTSLGVPFFVLKASFPLSWAAQILVGLTGLAMFPIVVYGIGAYDKIMQKTLDQRKITKEGIQEAERLSDPQNFSYEISARLLAHQIEEEEELKADKVVPDTERAEKSAAIKVKYEAARTRFNTTLEVLKAAKAKKDSGSWPGGPASTPECMAAMAALK